MAPTEVPTTTSGRCRPPAGRQHADLAGAEQPAAAQHERDRSLTHGADPLRPRRTASPALGRQSRVIASSRSSTRSSLRSPSWPSSLVDPHAQVADPLRGLHREGVVDVHVLVVDRRGDRDVAGGEPVGVVERRPPVVRREQLAPSRPAVRPTGRSRTSAGQQHLPGGQQRPGGRGELRQASPRPAAPPSRGRRGPGSRSTRASGRTAAGRRTSSPPRPRPGTRRTARCTRRRPRPAPAGSAAARSRRTSPAPSRADCRRGTVSRSPRGQPHVVRRDVVGDRVEQVGVAGVAVDPAGVALADPLEGRAVDVVRRRGPAAAGRRRRGPGRRPSGASER